MTAQINYYVFDSIKQDDDGTTWGYKNGQMTEVFFLSADDTESELIDKGFAKCDAPDWDETMVVEETAWATL
jgi:hypothetical protein